MDISIIMPAYNAADYLSEALECIFSQEFKGRFELLIADDCSSDSTRNILHDYLSQYPNLIKVVYNNENLGCSNNSIQLCKLAQGKYLAFCDSDDIWIDKLKLQKQFDFLENHIDYGMVCSLANTIDDQGNVVKLAPQGNNELFEDVDIKSLLRTHEDVYNSSIMMRREIYLKMLDDSMWYVENKCLFDTLWAYYFALKSKICQINEPLIAFRYLENSDSHSTDLSKRIKVDRRYYAMKLRFMLQNNMDVAYVMSVLMDEYDYVSQNMQYIGEQKVRTSLSYRLGKRLTRVFSKFKK